MIVDNYINRHTVDLELWSIHDTMNRFLADQGHTAVNTGCLVGDQMMIWNSEQLMVWQSDQPGALANALGERTGLVDHQAAVPTATALTYDQSKLVVAVCDLLDCGVVPRTFDVITVETAGCVGPFHTNLGRKPSQWRQLQTYLATQIGFAVEAGFAINVLPIVWNGHDPVSSPHNNEPAVTVWAEPGNDIERGDGFFIDDSFSDHAAPPNEPFAPYRRSSLGAVAEAVCDVAASWGVSPANLRTVVMQTYNVPNPIPS